MIVWSSEHIVILWCHHIPNQGVGPTLLMRCCWIRCMLGLFREFIIVVNVYQCVVVSPNYCYSYLLLQYCLLLHIDEFIINVQCRVGKLWPAHIVHDSLETTSKTLGRQLNVDWVNCTIHTWTPTIPIWQVFPFWLDVWLALS